MCHVCGFICYLCVELKLMINTRSLSNQALKSAHPSLLSSRCWPWVFIGAGQSLQHGEVRDTNLAWVRPVLLATTPLELSMELFNDVCWIIWHRHKLFWACFSKPAKRFQRPQCNVCKTYQIAPRRSNRTMRNSVSYFPNTVSTLLTFVMNMCLFA